MFHVDQAVWPIASLARCEPETVAILERSGWYLRALQAPYVGLDPAPGLRLAGVALHRMEARM